jgi:hypothetical protein
MGDVVSIEDYRALRTRPGAVSAVTGPIERLALAVRRLEATLAEAQALDEPSLCRELHAVNGAVSLGRYSTAAARTERLIRRLRED